MIDNTSINHHFQKPIILISQCLEFEACRYDGENISNQYIYALKPHVKFIPICPEVEIGLEIPRELFLLYKIMIIRYYSSLQQQKT